MTPLEAGLRDVLARLIGQVRVGALVDPHGLNTAMNARVIEAETLLRELQTPATAFHPDVPIPGRMIPVAKRARAPHLRLVSS